MSLQLPNNLKGLPALTIRQPWAWLILNMGKDVENRRWRTKFRGRFLIHAAKGCEAKEYVAAAVFAREAIGQGSNWARNAVGILERRLPALEDLEKGGIVGTAEIVDCVTKSDSRWYTGDYGFVLRDVLPVSFIACKGALGFFNPEKINKDSEQ